MRGWAVDTTARNPQRLREILQLLEKHFSGGVWNERTQADFTRRMIQQGLYLPKSIPKQSLLALRGRTWAAALNRMGFARAHANEPVLITDVGYRLLSRNVDENDVFLRQMLKWQFPSPIERFSRVNLRPFVALLHLAKNLQGLSKDEIAVFMFTLLDGRRLSQTSQQIMRFRTKMRLLQAAKETHMEQTIKRRLDGSAVSLSTARRWLANYRDYSDALIRYLCYTGLFSLDKSNLVISLEKQNEAEWILGNYTPSAGDFGEGSSFLSVYYNPDQPELAWDSSRWIATTLKEVRTSIKEVSRELTFAGYGSEISIPPSLFKPTKTKEKTRARLQKAENMFGQLAHRLENIKKIEEVGVRVTLDYEESQGRLPTNVSDEYRGYDVFSKNRNEKRYIEIKAFAKTGVLQLTSHEWLVARKFGINYWLYVVENASIPNNRKMYIVRDPFRNLSAVAQLKDTIQLRVIIRNWKSALQLV